MPESRGTFHQQLDEIQRDLLRLAARVIETITKGTEALLDLDLAAAQELIDGDDEIDVLTLDIEERCFTVLARQQPMASDMRAVVTAIRLTSEIERSGDLMVNVAKAARRLYGTEIPARLRRLLAADGGGGRAPLSAWPWTPTPTATATWPARSTTWTTGSTSSTGVHPGDPRAPRRRPRRRRARCSWPWSAATTSASATTP